MKYVRPPTQSLRVAPNNGGRSIGSPNRNCNCLGVKMIPHPRVLKTRTIVLITILTLGSISFLAHVFAKAKTGGSLALQATNISPNAPLNEGTALNTSNLFGGPVSGEVNQAGDYAFVGSGTTALFLRRAGSGTTQRL